MSTLFNTKTGEVNICGAILLKAGVSMEAVETSGLQLHRTYPAGKNRALRSYAPCEQSGKKIYFTLLFHLDRLVSVSFGFINDRIDSLVPQAEYVNFLRDELGSPTEIRQNGLIVSYEYSWGTITAAYDPRNDSSGITVRWKNTTN